MTDLAGIRRLLLEGDHTALRQVVGEALAEGRPASEVLEDGLIAGMRFVGEEFKHRRIFIPQVLLAARAMKTAMGVLEPLLSAGSGRRRAEVVVLGTVKGDLHDIGKNLVGMMCEGAGLTVVDLGTDISAERFVAAIREHRPAILGMSALLTTTMVYMATVVHAVRSAGLKQVRICVGGAPVSESFAEEIGADGYAADAGSAVELFRRMIDSRAPGRPEP